MNLIDFFDRGAKHYPDNVCLQSDELSLTYREVFGLSQRIANGILAEGFGKGFNAAVYSHNAPIAFTIIFGILRAGGVWLPVNARNSVEDNISFLGDMDCEILFYHSRYSQQVASIRQAIPKIKKFICLDKAEAGVSGFDEWVMQYEAKTVSNPIDMDALAVIMGTGGTTGRSKGVMLTNRNIMTLFANMMAVYDITEGMSYLAAAPITHTAGLLAIPYMVWGARIILHDGVDPQKILRTIQDEKVNVFFLPPTVIYVLLSMPNVREFNFSSLRYFFYGAAPMSPDKLKEAIEVFGPVMVQQFGQSEAPGSITYMSIKDHFDKEGNFASRERLMSCGRPMPFNRVGIMDDNGLLLAPREIGEIVVQGDLVMKGYYKNPQATEEVSAYGWHHTGDIGFYDEDNFFHIVDRKKDMIVTGGFNVFSTEVEKVLQSHPAVQDCVIIGVPDEKWGESVKGVVEFKKGSSVLEEELIALCKEKLGSVKAPKSIDIVDMLPRSSVGKVLKREVRAKYWAGRDRLVN